jgi:ABC-type antimicrobial peptide transport system permease subunit
MFKNYFKTAFRNLVRNKFFTLLNILGLSTSLACTILILLWVVNELSYDRFNKNAAHTYRITATTREQSFPMTGAPLGEAITNQVPGIRYTARLRPNYGESTIFTVGEHNFEEKRAYYADPALLQVFSFPLLQGAPATALVQPDGLLLTESMAKKYFGTEKAMGKTIRMTNSRMKNTAVFTVTGILKDIPATSHLQFDILLPMSFIARTDENILKAQWDNLNFYTYIVLDEHTAATPAALVAMEQQIRAINKKGEPTFDAVFQLQPLTKIHLYSKLLYDVDGQGNIVYVRIFSIIAFFILLVACINFMNLATAQSARRAKEVGIRKVIGARRGQLIGQFLSESVLITFIAMLLGLTLVIIALPDFNQVLGKALTLDLSDGWLFVGLLLVFLLTSLVSGSYPAFFLSSFRPIRVLKAKVARAGFGSHLFRNTLVVFQFAVSIVLIVGTVVVYSQLHFIRSRDLGYNKANLLFIWLKGPLRNNTDALAAGLKGSTYLHNYSILSELPVNAGMGTVGVIWEGKPKDSWPMFSVMGVDEHFFSVFGMRLATGRSFSTAFAADTLNYVVNEKALQVMGMNVTSAVGKPLTVWGNKGTIVGVVKDFNFKPVQSAVDPLILRYNPGAGKEWLRGVAVINVAPGRIRDAIDNLKVVWTELNPAYDFEFGFVDRQLEKLYRSEQRMGLLFNTFSLLAIFISCLGLSGLAAFTAEQRTKEIGVRKVLGATVSGIVAMLSKGFVKLVVLATLIATPISYYFMDHWLRDFAYRISISGWYFAAAGAAALLIALFTVSFQAVKAALANPVKSLRAE